MPEINKGPSDGFKIDSRDLGLVTQNTWYEVLNVKNVQVLLSGVKITVADETVEMRVTIDGEVIACSAGVALAFAGNNCCGLKDLRWIPASGDLFVNLTAAGLGPLLDLNSTVPHWCKGKSVLIEARKTTAGGASHILALTTYMQK